MALSVAFRTPTPLNSMDLQWGQHVEDNRTARVMAPRQLSPDCPRQGRRDPGWAAWRSMHGGHCAGRRQGGSLPALP